MPYRERHYYWKWRLRSSPEELWPLLTDTNRFNRDTGLPKVITERVDEKNPNVRLMRFRYLGITIRWEEFPFNWTKPNSFGVLRRYRSGPLHSVRMASRLEPDDSGSTVLHYEVWACPRNLLGAFLIPLQIGFVSRRAFGRAFTRYDQLASRSTPIRVHESTSPGRFSRGARARQAKITDSLLAAGVDASLAERLFQFVEKSDDLSLMRIRPYHLADLWQASRSAVLDGFLYATRLGLFDFRWEILCPLCRGAKQTVDHLDGLNRKTHCDTCNISFSSNFEKGVELVFAPNPTIRHVESSEFCIGGPQVTPHIVAQRTMAEEQAWTVPMAEPPGRYRIRASQQEGFQLLTLDESGPSDNECAFTSEGWSSADLRLRPPGNICLRNDSDQTHLFLIEQVSWMDDALFAADVTTRQTFRDLFATEVLRPSEKVSVGALTLVFTDLKDSTRLYQHIGDAPAFGLVMSHFDVVRRHIAKNEGALIKTMGDAVMAAFRRPIGALQAFLGAQQELSRPTGDRGPLPLKVGIHLGPCIAINQDDRLDYFGTTVNFGARLEGQSTGSDIVLSQAVYDDPEVRSFLQRETSHLTVLEDVASLKGFDEGSIPIKRISIERVSVSESDLRFGPEDPLLTN